ncbi:MAG: response regulator [Planctomycetota bacterium]
MSPEPSELRIMMVDDDENLLGSLRRQMHGKYTASCVESPSRALEIFDQYGPFALVVSDMRMPGMSGIELIAEIRKRSPNTVAIILTGDGDMETAARAVNESHVFRFLNKPCKPDALLEAVRLGLEHYRLATAEADLLNKTLAGSVRMLTQVLSMTMPEAFGLAQEAKSLTGEICHDLEHESTWQAEMAAMLMRIGMVAISPDIAKRYLRGHELESSEWAAVERSAQKGCELISAIPRLEPVGELVGLQYKDQGVNGNAVAKVLRAVGDFQRFSIRTSVFETLRRMERDDKYDERIMGSLRKIVSQRFQSSETTVNELCEGMILEEEIRDKSGRLLLSKGTEMHKTMVERIQTMQASGIEIVEPICVRFFKLAASSQDAIAGAA